MLVIFYGVDNSKKTTRAKALVDALQKKGFRAKFTKRPHKTPPEGLTQEELYDWMFEDAALHYMEEIHPFRKNTIIIQDRGVLCAEVYNKPKGSDPAFDAYKAQGTFASKVFAEIGVHYKESGMLSAMGLFPDLHVFCRVWQSDLYVNYRRKGEKLTAEIRVLSAERQQHYKEMLDSQEAIGIPCFQLHSSQLGVWEPLFEDVTLRRLVHTVLTQAELLNALDNYKETEVDFA